MLDNISFNRFCNVDSRLRRMNPISKILCVIIFLILTFVDSSIEFNLILLIFVFAAMLLSNISFKVYGKILLGLLSFIIFIFFINFLCDVNINISILFSIRLILIVLYSSILTLTTSPDELIYGLEHILSPLKIFKLPINSLALILSLTIRFIPLVFEMGKGIIKCYESRGIKFSKLSLRNKLSYMKSIIIPVFVLAFKNSDELTDTMNLRLYDTNQERTSLHIYGYGKIDAYTLSFHVMLMMCLIMKGIY